MIVGPGNEAAGASGHGHLRASDVDRDQTIDVLKAAFTQGRLTKDELDERVGQVLAARTYADLNALTSDIPRDLAPAPKPLPPQARIEEASITPRGRAIIATTLLSAVTFVVAFLINDGAVSALMALGAVASAFVSLSLLIAETRSMRRDTPEHRQPCENRVIGSDPAADPQAVSATEQLPWAKPRPPSRTEAATARRRRGQPVAVA